MGFVVSIYNEVKTITEHLRRWLTSRSTQTILWDIGEDMLDLLGTCAGKQEPSLGVSPALVFESSALLMSDTNASCFRRAACVWHAAVQDLAADCPQVAGHAEPKKTVILENAGMLLPFSFSAVVKTVFTLLPPSASMPGPAWIPDFMESACYKININV